MAWTYASMAEEETRSRDLVRFYVGDTHASDQLVQDEEIAGVLMVYPDRERIAAAAICEALAAKFSRLIDVQTAQKKVSMSQIALRYAARADWLRKLEEDETVSTVSGAVIAPPYVAGLSLAEADLDRADPDLPVPPFGLVGDLPSPVLFATAPAETGEADEDG